MPGSVGSVGQGRLNDEQLRRRQPHQDLGEANPREMGTDLMLSNGREGRSDLSLMDKEKVVREEAAKKNVGAVHLEECRITKSFQGFKCFCYLQGPCLQYSRNQI